MAPKPGEYCAGALVAVGLPHAAIVRVLMQELQLTFDEATAATLEACGPKSAARRLDEWWPSGPVRNPAPTSVDSRQLAG